MARFILNLNHESISEVKYGITFNPNKVVCDFELERRKAVKTVLPSVELPGCYFHFRGRTLKKIIKEFKLVSFSKKSLKEKPRVEKCKWKFTFRSVEKVDVVNKTVLDDPVDSRNLLMGWGHGIWQHMLQTYTNIGNRYTPEHYFRSRPSVWGYRTVCNW